MGLLYFAYGIFMNHEHIRERCQTSRFLKRAYLPDHQFIFDGYPELLRKKSLANIIDRKDYIVWGGLFEISEDDLKMLDSSDIYKKTYQKKTVSVIDDDGNLHEAIVYFREQRQLCPPSKEYRNMIIQGAKDCDLPENYILKISYGLNA